MGGIAGALIGMGIPEYEAKRYEGRIKGGNILLSLHADDSQWTDKAESILKDTGAEDISSGAEVKGDYANADIKSVPEGFMDSIDTLYSAHWADRLMPISGGGS